MLLDRPMILSLDKSTLNLSEGQALTVRMTRTSGRRGLGLERSPVLRLGLHFLPVTKGAAGKIDHEKMSEVFESIPKQSVV